MSLPLYLLRHPKSNVSSCLISLDHHRVSVLLEECPSSSQQVATIEYGDVKPVPTEQALTYKELLEVLLKAGKVVTL